MIPINKTKETCTPTSSNCVKWPAIELEGIDICRDASVTEVILALSDKLKNIIDTLNIDTYELKCLENAKCGPKEFSDLVQLIINKLCELSNNDGVDITIPVLDIDVDCFKDMNNGHSDITIANFALLIAQKICDIYTQLNSITERLDGIDDTLKEHETDISNLKESKQDKLSLLDYDGVSTIPDDEINTALQYVHDFVCISSKSIIKNDDPAEIYNSAREEEPLSDTTFSLTDNTTITDNIKSLWTLMCDTRRAVKTIRMSLDVPSIIIEAYMTCAGNIWYKAKCNYKDPISEGSITFKDYYSLYDGIEISFTNNPTVLDGSYKMPDGQTKISASGKVNYGGGQQPFTFDIKNSITNAEQIAQGKKIKFKKNISFKKVILKLKDNVSDETVAQEWSAEQTGMIEYEETTYQFISGETYTFSLYIEDENIPCASFDYVAPWPDVVKPNIIWNGEVDDEDKVNINTVLPEEYDDWVAKFE